MFIKPSRVALSAGKLGKTLFWAGANDELFYIFNLTSDPKKVYYGRYADLGALRMSQIVLPVAPADLSHNCCAPADVCPFPRLRSLRPTLLVIAWLPAILKVGICFTIFYV